MTRGSPFSNLYFMGFACIMCALFVYADFKYGQVNGMTLLTAAMFVWCFIEALIAWKKK